MFDIVIVSLTAVAILIAVLIYFSDAPNWLKFISLPSWIMASIFIIWFFVMIAGAPLNRFPIGKWEYVHHKAMNGGQIIMLWAYSNNLDGFRLYQFPYNRETMKKLDQAQKDQENGGRTYGEFKNKRGNTNEQPELETEQGKARTDNPIKPSN